MFVLSDEHVTSCYSTVHREALQSVLSASGLMFENLSKKENNGNQGQQNIKGQVEFLMDVFHLQCHFLLVVALQVGMSVACCGFSLFLEQY